MQRKLLIMGLPGAGKTTLAHALLPRINAVHLNADDVRKHVHRDLTFSIEDRVEHARRLGWLCDQIVKSGSCVIADFICPTTATREAFGEAFVVWVDRIKEGRFADTNKLFEPPQRYDIRVTDTGAPAYWAEKIAAAIRPVFDPKRPTALLVGRYQPFHAGHKALIEEALRRVDQVCIGVRDTAGLDDKNPYSYDFVRTRIENALRQHAGRFTVISIPNISGIYYGRDVGYVVEKIDLGEHIEGVSATEIRRQMRSA